MRSNAEEPLPPSVSALSSDTAAARARYPLAQPSTYRHSRVRPPLLTRILNGSLPDTPSASFYRIYEFFILGWNIEFRNELEYFCRSHPDWLVSSIPDPKDHSNPVRYAIFAVLAQLMCDAFNRRIDMGIPRDAPAIIQDFEELAARPKVFEELPDWAKLVPAAEEKVFIPNNEGETLREEDETVSEEFRRMNIIAQRPHIHFV